MNQRQSNALATSIDIQRQSGNTNDSQRMKREPAAVAPTGRGVLLFSSLFSLLF
ncbi:hypothetical protein [Paraburkholderia sp.]|uniref:hypothetical protein n=1 Tax=Paraburkholderia sp. TaxID=1926495 RepID=UPI002D38CF8E|nr:hypothetical protein [Paraburkholderia sp.]HZZ05457.1 hypothetical protein [Paraburkholderia sp.]